MRAVSSHHFLRVQRVLQIVAFAVFATVLLAQAPSASGAPGSSDAPAQAAGQNDASLPFRW